MRREVRVIDTSWEFLVDIIIVKSPWPPKSRTQIVIQAIGTPENPFATLDFDHVRAIRCFHATLAMDTNSKNQVSGCTEQTPTMIDPRPSEEVETLT